MLLDLNIAEPAPRAAMAYDPGSFPTAWPEPAQRRAHNLRACSSSRIGLTAAIPWKSPRKERPAASFQENRSATPPSFIRTPSPPRVRGSSISPTTHCDEGQWALAKQALLRSGRSTLIYFDGDKARVEAADLNVPSGLALSPDGSRLYVAESTGTPAAHLPARCRKWRARARGNPSTWARRRGISNVDDDGVVWIAAYPKLLRLAAHLRDPRKRSPTQVLRFDPRIAKPRMAGTTRASTEVYVNDGARDIRADPRPRRWRDEFLIGALFDKKVLICKPNP